MRALRARLRAGHLARDVEPTGGVGYKTCVPSRLAEREDMREEIEKHGDGSQTIRVILTTITV